MSCGYENATAGEGSGAKTTQPRQLHIKFTLSTRLRNDGRNASSLQAKGGRP